MKDILLFDSVNTETSRTVLDNGVLQIDNCILTEAVVSKYRGSELSNPHLQQDKVYYVYRATNELEKAKDTFNNLPLLNEHQILTKDNPPKDPIGYTGASTQFINNQIIDTIFVSNDNGIKLVNNGKTALSCGYTADFVERSGSFNGVDYDLIMTNIKGNHVALVNSPRVTAAQVADSANNFNNGVNKMDNTTPKEAIKNIDDIVDKWMEEFGIPDNDTKNMVDGKARDNRSYMKDAIHGLMSVKDEGEDEGEDEEDSPTMKGQAQDSLPNIDAKKLSAMIDRAVQSSLEKQSKQIHDSITANVIAFDEAISIAEKPSMLGKINRQVYAQDAKKVYKDIANKFGLKTDGMSFDALKASVIAIDSVNRSNPNIRTTFNNKVNNALNNINANDATLTKLIEGL